MAVVLPSKAKPASVRAARLADESYGATAQPDWREVDWREYLHEIELDGSRLSYVDIGSGEEPPVVFVHGLGGCWQNWLENLPRTSLERRAIALDLPGFGRSEMPLDEISVRNYGRTVDRLCDRLDLGEVVLVGNSMGGFIAAEVAIRRPERVARLVLVSAAGISINSLYRRPARTWGRAAVALGAYGAANLQATIARPRLRHIALALVARHPTRLKPDLCWELMNGAGHNPGFTDALNALLDYDFRERLGEIRAATLIVWGTDDMMVPVEDADEFERLISNTRKVLFEDTGHVSMIERPETFNRCLMEFIAEKDATARDAGAEAAA
jgi:pimeloyl-ACP methyl ester carboxylesterase